MCIEILRRQPESCIFQPLPGDRLQNVVVPLPATNASQDASSVHVFLGSSSNPDVGSPLDEVNQLLQKATNIQKGLVATSNLQLSDSTFLGVKQMPRKLTSFSFQVARSTAPLVGDFEGSFLAQGLLRRKDFLWCSKKNDGLQGIRRRRVKSINHHPSKWGHINVLLWVLTHK